jgi:hypothetical protein
MTERKVAENPIKVCKGARLRFANERGTYRVRCISERYAICTRPHNPLRTVIYSIIDIERGIRGPHNLVLNVYDFRKDDGCEECLKDLIDGKIEVSSRNHVDLVFSE